ncbi:TPA: hypothetical protein HA338_11605 [Methanosarcina acetivorans]|uniref:Uncharacterized protein n=1 Tax=Methanosarcina acetivorans TaxID=2214 RepID=A0A832SK58_9EURY|nr:hypothetical protein [Methanosarcina acetivorans]HIH94633.1 hypothetical protein [Methanosarcina acetivorans]
MYNPLYGLIEAHRDVEARYIISGFGKKGQFARSICILPGLLIYAG